VILESIILIWSYVLLIRCAKSFVADGVLFRLIGFEELGNTDAFPTSMLERRLIKSGVIIPQNANPGSKKSNSIFKFDSAERQDDEDDDWD
jgi:hypothetical protein